MKWPVWKVALPLLLCWVGVPLMCLAAPQAIIGETAWIGLGGVPYRYLARIDTGAELSSLHAIALHVEGDTGRASENVGKEISFVTVSRAGLAREMRGVIVGVSAVQSPQGIELRYVIELTLSWGGIIKRVKVNLRDRTAMRYKLLVGRNWLSGSVVVDVAIQAADRGTR